MKLDDVLKDFYTYSEKASDVYRQLALAGIAAIWVFRPTHDDQTVALPPVLYVAGAMLVLSLGMDISQYFIGALTWGNFHRQKELEKVPADSTIRVPPDLARPMHFCFRAKILLLYLSYALLLWFMSQTIFVHVAAI